MEYPAKGASQGRCGAITKKAEEADEFGEFGDAGKFGELTVIFLLASWVEVWAWLGKVIHFMGKDKTLSLYMGDKLARESRETRETRESMGARAAREDRRYNKSQWRNLIKLRHCS